MTGLVRALVCGLALLLPSTSQATGPASKSTNCTYPDASKCLRNSGPDYLKCYRGSAPHQIISACKAWLEKHPLDIEAEIRMAGQYRGLGDYDAAIAIYTKVIQARPKSPSGYFDRGWALEMKGEKVPAIADYQKSLELDPKFQLALERLKRIDIKLP